MVRRSIWSLISEEEREAIQAEVRSSWQQRLVRYPERTLLWLAIMPFCTIALAEACSFPLNQEEHETIRDLFASLLAEELCDVKQASPGLVSEDQRIRMLPESDDRHDYYTLAETLRSYLLQRVQFDAARGMPELLRELQILGQLLLDAAQKGSSPSLLPSTLARWAELASSASSIGAVSKRFGEKIEELLVANQLNEELRWIEAARQLAEVLKGALTLAVDQAARRLDLQHRRAHDEQYLTHFLVRDEQIAAFNRLLDQKNSSSWALHFVAPGGFGKTMLLRHLTARLIPKRGGSVARVDFDYLNPGYPSRAPALLLDQFVQELRLQGNAESEKEFVHFSRKMTTFYERFTSGLIGGATMAQTLEDAEFLDLLRTFARGLSSLPQPVVLILDTCEEMAKIRPGGVLPENVRATFQILEQLHRILPSLRVIFSGRRPLASSGAGSWSCRSSSHPRRPYLRLHEIRGFTREESLSYLRYQMQVREELIEPILEKSPDTDKGGLFSYGSRSKQQAASLEPRYNPFDLWLYANWGKADSELTAETLRAADMDRYIEQLIVGRIDHPDLRALLPAVSLLGHFDRETLREVSPINEDAFNAVFQELQNQEWIQMQQFTFWKVKRGLWERLRAYYRKTNPVALGEIRRRTIPYLERITQEWPLEQLNISHFDVALRLLEETDPVRAADWWEKIEARFASEPNAYGWVNGLMEWLESEEGAIAEGNEAEGRPESVLRAAVLATYAAAQLHTTPARTTDRLESWVEVMKKLGHHPTEAGRARLSLRAKAAICMLTEEKDVVQLFELLFDFLSTAFQQSQDEQSIAALIAALEALIEQYEPKEPEIIFPEGNVELAAPARPELPDWQPLLTFVDQLDPSQISPELHTFALTLAARACKMAGDWPGMENYFAQALARTHNLRSNLQCWLDWRAPVNLAARVQLEYIRACYPALRSPQHVLEQLGSLDVASQQGRMDIDQDRLQTALLQLHAAQSPPHIFDEQTMFPAVGYEDVRRSFTWELTCNAHRTFQPFYAARAEEEARQGSMRNAANAFLEPPPSIGPTTMNQAAMERTELRIDRLARWKGFGRDYSGYDEQWAIDGLLGPQIKPGELADFSRRISSRLSAEAENESEYAALLCHARWRTSYTLRLEWALAAIGSQLAAIEMRVSSQIQPEEPSFATLSLALDALEINAICQRIGIPPFLPTLSAAQLQSIREHWFAAHQDQPVAALRLALRATALDAGRSLSPQFPGELLQRIGVRRAAQIALDEGELLALRLTENATMLLDQALIWFAACQDPMSQFIATTTLALAHARLGNHQQIVQLLRSHFGHQYFGSIRDLMSLLYTQGGEPVRSLEEISALRDLLEEELFRRMLAEMTVEQRAVARDEILAPSWLWRSWLVRWLACAIWSIGPGADMQELERWLKGTYAATIIGPGDYCFPAELDDWPNWPSQQATLIRPPQADQPAIPLLQLDQPRPVHREDGTIVLSFSSKDDPGNIRRGGLSVTMKFEARPGSTLFDPTSFSHAEDLRVHVFETPPTLMPAFIPYTQSAGRTPSLKDILGYLPPTRPITLELSVDEATSSLCWEGFIRLALAQTSQQNPFQNDLQQIHMYRIMARPANWPSPRTITQVAVMSDSISARALQAMSWRELADNPLVTVGLYEIERFFTARQDYQKYIDVLHMIAPVSEGKSGQVGIATSPDLPKYLEAIPELVLFAETIVRNFPELSFCILQVPTGPMIGRSETDRELAALQRRFAAQLFLCGVPIVLSVPALPVEVGERVVRCICETMRNREIPSRPALLSALAEARSIILEQASDWPSEVALEVAMDMCLYGARGGNANQ